MFLHLPVSHSVQGLVVRDVVEVVLSLTRRTPHLSLAYLHHVPMPNGSLIAVLYPPQRRRAPFDPLLSLPIDVNAIPPSPMT